MAHYPGYTVLRTEDCPEQHGTLTLLTHDVSGAAVLLVENEDVNKAFGIGFGTFPSDDTGVFHILEHSVLAGSEKYPVSSPFVQLLKSSMASFLNAMTFPDKTVYPFATPNETDFCNLMDVYLNAVFCPLAMVDSAVFEQEAGTGMQTARSAVWSTMKCRVRWPPRMLSCKTPCNGRCSRIPLTALCPAVTRRPFPP